MNKSTLQNILRSALFSILMLFSAKSNAQMPLVYHLALDSLKNNLLRVTLDIPDGVREQEEVIFCLPAIIPGTYSRDEFGRFVKELKAYDIKGAQKETERLDKNRWKLINPKKITKLVYWVEGTWDSRQQETVFEPAGTHYDPENHVFLLNPPAITGFFLNMQYLPVKVNISYPAKERIIASKYLTPIDQGKVRMDADSYADLIDQPIMVGKFDTLNLPVGNTQFRIALYTESDSVSIRDIKDALFPLFQCYRTALGSLFSRKMYTIMVYIATKAFKSKTNGALEHNNGTAICVNYQANKDELMKEIRSVAAHEFLHMITPIYLHGAELENFNYMKGVGSPNLWFYEGVIEYLSQQLQAKYGLMTLKEFTDILSQKAKFSKIIGKISLYDTGVKVFEPEFHRYYANVYYRGAMLAMCLDLYMLDVSEGRYGLIQLLKDLCAEYAPGFPFKNEEFLSDIDMMSHGNKGIFRFLDKYVNDTASLPFSTIMPKAGFRYSVKGTRNELSPTGSIENNVIRPDSLGRFVIMREEKLDNFGRYALGMKNGDVILEWNGQPFSPKSVFKIFNKLLASSREDDIMTVKVLRKGKETLLSAPLKPVKVDAEDVFEPMESVSEIQAIVRKAWLANNSGL